MRSYAIATVGAATVTATLLVFMTALLADDSVPVIRTVTLPPTLTRATPPTPPKPREPEPPVKPIDKPAALPTDRPNISEPIDTVLPPTLPPGDDGMTVPVPPGPPAEGPPGSGLGNGDAALVELVNVVPIYPARMLALGVEGYVDVRYDVNAMGRAENIEVTYTTHRGFEKAAIRGVERIRYQPRTIDGRAVPVRGVEKRFSFDIHE